MIRKSGHGRLQPGFWQHCRTLRLLRQAHGAMIVRGFLSSQSQLRELVFAAAVAIRGAFSYAYQVFFKIPEPDIFMYNTIIRGAAHSTTPCHSFVLFREMVRSGIRPNNLTFPFLLRSCISLHATVTGMQLHGAISKIGLENDMFVRNALVGMHASCGVARIASTLFDESGRRDAVAWSAMISGHARRGNLDAARSLFDKSPEKDDVSWNVMIAAYAKHEAMEEARALFERAPERDVVSWNTMISGYAKKGLHEQAMEMFEKMSQEGQRPDDVTMLCLVSACADSGILDVGKRLHYLISSMPRQTGLSIALGNALINMYAKCGSLSNAMEVFRGMKEKDISTWNSVIGGLALHGHSQDSMRLFRQMLKEGVRPDSITFLMALVACSYGGMIREGQRYFKLMQSRHDVEPNVKHFGCMVDMLGRAGMLKEACDIISGMKVQPNAVLWRSLLGACKLHGNVELAEHANRELVKARDEDSGGYILLSNIYASIGEWRGSERMRALMDGNQVSKEAGRAHG